jgi:hypothetical protein
MIIFLLHLFEHWFEFTLKLQFVFLAQLNFQLAYKLLEHEECMLAVYVLALNFLCKYFIVFRTILHLSDNSC